MSRSHLIRIEGQRFGALTVLKRDRGTAHGMGWLCQCDCGQKVVVRGDKLRQGRKKTCGINGHNWRQHMPRGITILHRSEYQSWENMHTRCNDKRHKNYKNYGGRGITVDTRWNEFKNFLADMGKKPSPAYTIERVNNGGPYEPGNCRWATRAEQRRNMRNSIIVVYEGQQMLLMDVIAKLGLNSAIVRSRIKIGWDLEDALQTPVRPKTKKRRRQRKPLDNPPPVV